MFPSNNKYTKQEMREHKINSKSEFILSKEDGAMRRRSRVYFTYITLMFLLKLEIVFCMYKRYMLLILLSYCYYFILEEL